MGEKEKQLRQQKYVSVFRPDLEKIRAIRNCELASVDALCEAGSLDPKVDFADYRFSEFDWRDSQTSKYIVKSPLPDHGTAQSFFDASFDSQFETVQDKDAGSDSFGRKQVNSPQSGFQSFLQSMANAVNAASNAYQREGGLSGISTGLFGLDRILGGLHRSELLVVAGRPSMGTTAFATNIAFNIAKSYKRGIRPDGAEGTVDGGVVGFFSLEMSAEQLASRILSEASEVPVANLRRGDMDEAEFGRFVRAAKSLEAAPLFIDDTTGMSIDELVIRALELKQAHGLDAIFIDKLQILKANSGRQSASTISKKLVNLAKELSVPVLVTSEVSEALERRDSKIPLLSDLRGFGTIAGDADVVMFLFREEYYVEREKPEDFDLESMELWMEKMERLHGRAEVIVAKQRSGPIGSVDLAFKNRYLRFGNLV